MTDARLRRAGDRVNLDEGERLLAAANDHARAIKTDWKARAAWLKWRDEHAEALIAAARERDALRVEKAAGFVSGLERALGTQEQVNELRRTIKVANEALYRAAPGLAVFCSDDKAAETWREACCS